MDFDRSPFRKTLQQTKQCGSKVALAQGIESKGGECRMRIRVGGKSGGVKTWAIIYTIL
jgi:hypothetical protein